MIFSPLYMDSGKLLFILEVSHELSQKATNLYKLFLLLSPIYYVARTLENAAAPM